jgi:RimJ/RimL family protein N-acetyltransferase
MQPLPTLRGRRVVLAPFRDEDAVPLFRWINTRELVELSAPFAPVTWEDHLRWFDAVRADGAIAAFGIRDPEDDRLVGSCQLLGIDSTERTAELRIRIGDEGSRARGRGTEAVELLTRFGLEDLRLERIWLEVFQTNRPALRVYEKAGFRREGVRTGAAVIAGRAKDVILMSLVRNR